VTEIEYSEVNIALHSAKTCCRDSRDLAGPAGKRTNGRGCLVKLVSFPANLVHPSGNVGGKKSRKLTNPSDGESMLANTQKRNGPNNGTLEQQAIQEDVNGIHNDDDLKIKKTFAST